jgi:hypothetical protein
MTLLYIFTIIIIIVIIVYIFTYTPYIKNIYYKSDSIPTTPTPTTTPTTTTTTTTLPPGGIWSKLDCDTNFCTFKPYPFKTVNGSYTIEEAEQLASSIGANAFTLYKQYISFFNLKGNNKIASRFDSGNGESYYYEYGSIDPDDCEYSDWVCDCSGIEKRKLTRGSEYFCRTNVGPLTGSSCTPNKNDCDWYYFYGGYIGSGDKYIDKITTVNKDFCFNKCKKNPNCVGCVYSDDTQCILFDNDMVQHVYDKTKNDFFRNRGDTLVYVNRYRLGEDRWNRLNDSTGSYIYSIDPNDKSLDCVVGNTWGDWGECTKGVKTRTKNTTSPTKYGGSCNPEKQKELCVSDCTVGEWTKYRGCVNDDKKIRTRPTISPPYNGGTCNEVLIEKAKCDFIEGEWPSYIVGGIEYGPVYIDLVNVDETGRRNYSISGEKVFTDISNLVYDPFYKNPSYESFTILKLIYTRHSPIVLDENRNAVKIGTYLKRPSPKRPIVV